MDYYPYHLASSDKKHWPCYRENVTPHTHWQEQALNAFKSKFMDLIERNKIQHVPLSRANVKRVRQNYIYSIINKDLDSNIITVQFQYKNTVILIGVHCVKFCLQKLYIYRFLSSN